ncbi:hypothetical protein BU16DRAFT_544620 [Lophium mytilinum]|uniref:Uncharacterized protein n=1 Tax=Lophium mytilinum TaxID=390894 RepID=A0A6A6QAY2_9PEZI|nr:hypothetical protein BU16DRAFT_544620 [Lophium mytilinum]
MVVHSCSTLADVRGVLIGIIIDDIDSITCWRFRPREHRKIWIGTENEETPYVLFDHTHYQIDVDEKVLAVDFPGGHFGWPGIAKYTEQTGLTMDDIVEKKWAEREAAPQKAGRLCARSSPKLSTKFRMVRESLKFSDWEFNVTRPVRPDLLWMPSFGEVQRSTRNIHDIDHEPFPLSLNGASRATLREPAITQALSARYLTAVQTARMDPAKGLGELTDIQKRRVQESEDPRKLIEGKQALEPEAEGENGSVRAVLRELGMLCMLTTRETSTLTVTKQVKSEADELMAEQAELAFKAGSFPQGMPLDEQRSLVAFRECDTAVFNWVDVLGELLGGKATWWKVDTPVIGRKIWVKSGDTPEHKLFRHSVIRVDIGGRSYVLDPTGCQMGWWELVSDLKSFVARRSYKGEDLVAVEPSNERINSPPSSFLSSVRTVVKEIWLGYRVEGKGLLDHLAALSFEDRVVACTSLWLEVGAKVQTARDSWERTLTEKAYCIIFSAGLCTKKLPINSTLTHHELFSSYTSLITSRSVPNRHPCTHDVPLLPSPPSPPPPLHPPLHPPFLHPLPPLHARAAEMAEAQHPKRAATFAEGLKLLDKLDEDAEVPPLDSKDYNAVAMTAESVVRLCKTVLRRVSLVNVEKIIAKESAGSILGLARDAELAFTGGSFPPEATEEQKVALVAYRQCDLSVALCLQLLQEILKDYTIFRHSVAKLRGGVKRGGKRFCLIADPSAEQLGCTTSVVPEVKFEDAHDCLLNEVDEEPEVGHFTGFWAEVREVMAGGVTEVYGDKKTMFEKMKKMEKKERDEMQEKMTEFVGEGVAALIDAWGPTLKKGGRKGLRGERV